MEKDSILVNDSWIDSGMVSVAHFSRGLGLHRRYKLVLYASRSIIRYTLHTSINRNNKFPTIVVANCFHKSSSIEQ